MEKIDIQNFKKYYRNNDGNATVARVGHLNSIIEEVNTKITAPENPQTGDSVVWNGTDWVANNEWEEITLVVAGIDLQTCFSAPIDFSGNLPALDITTQYLDTEIYAHVEVGTIDFDFSQNLIISIGNSSIDVAASFVNNLASFPIPFLPFKVVGTYPGGSPNPIGGSISTTVSDATQGDSNLVLNIRYRIKTY
jgi:hypothetical protein